MGFVTGLEIESVVAECHSFLGAIDDDTQVMFRMTGDVRGTLTAAKSASATSMVWRCGSTVIADRCTGGKNPTISR